MDESIDFDERARKIAEEWGYDSFSRAGVMNGYHYFRIFRKKQGRYVGTHFIKIAPNGIKYNFLEDGCSREEWNWAMEQDVKINKYG